MFPIRIRIWIRMFLGHPDTNRDPIVRGTDPRIRIRIRIRTKVSRIRNTAWSIIILIQKRANICALPWPGMRWGNSWGAWGAAPAGCSHRIQRSPVWPLAGSRGTAWTNSKNAFGNKFLVSKTDAVSVNNFVKQRSTGTVLSFSMLKFLIQILLYSI